MIEKSKIVKAEAEENLEKAEFNRMVNLKIPIHKTPVDPNLLQLKVCLRSNQKEQGPEEFSTVFTELTERFGLLFVSDKIVASEELRTQVEDAPHFEHNGSTKILAEGNIFCWAGM